MGKSTEDQLPTYKQMTFEDSHSAIFLLESEAGHLPCNSQDGARIVLSGPDLVPVSRSVRQASKKGKKTNGISGRRCSGSSASVSLSQCLANRLRQRLGTDGLMEYRTTWREKITPLGRSYWEHSASAHRTKEADYSGWPTPTSLSFSESHQPGNNRSMNLTVSLIPTPWITPQTVVGLVGWPTPEASNDKERMSNPAIVMRRISRKQQIGLEGASHLTPWGTPASRDWKDGHQVDVQTNALLGRQAWLSTALTENRGVLDAAFSRWLMGFPAVWDEASPSFQDWPNVQEQIALGG